MPTHRPYRDEADFLALLDFLSAANKTAPEAGYLQPADLTWWMRQNNIFKPQESIELFEDAGKLCGFVFSNPPQWAAIQAAPHSPAALLDDMLAFAEARAGEKPLTVATFEGDAPLVAALERQDYGQGARMLNFEFHPHEQTLPDAGPLPDGFSFTSISDDPHLKSERVKIHQAVWHPSKVTLDAYEHLRTAPTYRPELDIALVAPDGRFAAYALGWYDPNTRIGIQEPVGTHPDFRGQGLGRLTVQEVTRRLIAAGANRITICTFEKNVAGVQLYLSSGYKHRGYIYDYLKPPQP